MIAFVDGTVEYIEETAAVINAGGFGCRIFMTPAALSALKLNETVRIHTYLRVAEDLFDLYGFLSREEMDMFKMLLSVNGAGPKAALAVLSALSPQALTLAVVIGLLIGVYDGLVGPGTGTFAIIAFTSVLKFDLRTASGNAKVLNLASNYASLITYIGAGNVPFALAIPCAVCNILGAILGSHFALSKGGKFIRPMLLVVLVLLLGKMAMDLLG